jgi:hypothetical protein
LAFNFWLWTIFRRWNPRAGVEPVSNLASQIGMTPLPFTGPRLPVALAHERQSKLAPYRVSAIGVACL